MAVQNFLAFDLGAESGRAVLGSLENGKLSLEEKHRFANPTGRMNGHLYWNILAQWEELKTGLRKAAADLAGRGGELNGLGVDTWGVDFGLIDSDGEILGYPYHYRDSRTDGIMEQTFKRVGQEKLFEATGIQFMQFNSLFQLIAAKQQRPQLLKMAATLLFMPDLFHYLFTGVRKSEFSIASTSQMYDMRRNQWAVELLERLGLPANLLPEVVPSGTLLGPVTAEVAAECKCGNVPVIAPAGHDTASAVASVPAEGNDWCYVSSGTWSLMGVELPEPIINETSRRFNYTNEGGVAGTIRFLKNIMGLWLVQECRRHWVREGHEHGYGELTQMAGRAQSFGPVIDPSYQPFLSPGDMPQKIEQFCRETRQSSPGTRGEFVRTCLESLALTYRHTLAGLEQILGRKINVIHIVGGGTQNELLNQMTADACNRQVIAGPVEATAAGNILVQAMATGDVKSLADARTIVRNSFEVKSYAPREAVKWDAAYKRYQGVVNR